jgi:hypothetical protein
MQQRLLTSFKDVERRASVSAPFSRTVQAVAVETDEQLVNLPTCIRNLSCSSPTG